MAYTVFRSDLLSGTDVASDLVSARVYDSGEKIAVENGTIMSSKVWSPASARFTRLSWLPLPASCPSASWSAPPRCSMTSA